MPSTVNARYPYHLAKLIARRLHDRQLPAPPDGVLLRLFETLYFASLRTDEGRPCRCTVNYVDPHKTQEMHDNGHNGNWTTIPFDEPVPLDVRTLIKLAEAADPTVSSLAVFSNSAGELFIWGMVDQELRYGDYVALDSASDPLRPGQFQATITGVGNICVYKNYTLLGSLEQNSLIQQYHDVLWDGPVHQLLRDNLASILHEDNPAANGEIEQQAEIEKELLVRWQNAVCRTLLNIQQYRHGGGLLILPGPTAADVNVKYRLKYDRLPQALLSLAQHQLLKRQTADTIAQHCQNPSQDVVPCEYHYDAVGYQEKLEQHKSAALGCVRFIASLSRVDGFVLLDKGLVVHGFGVELRPRCELSEIFVAGDSGATDRLLRPARLSHFGTRHRAMMRYCHQHPGALGFVISQDGDIRATMQVGPRLVLWENINVQLAFRAENRSARIAKGVPLMGLFQFWVHALARVEN